MTQQFDTITQYCSDGIERGMADSPIQFTTAPTGHDFAGYVQQAMESHVIDLSHPDAERLMKLEADALVHGVVALWWMTDRNKVKEYGMGVTRIHPKPLTDHASSPFAVVRAIMMGEHEVMLIAVMMAKWMPPTP